MGKTFNKQAGLHTSIVVKHCKWLWVFEKVLTGSYLQILTFVLVHTLAA
jgi:hypothetical protein